MGTYTNDDILDISRAWTGFDLQSPRGNVENYHGDASDNFIDPMKLKGIHRDVRCWV